MRDFIFIYRKQLIFGGIIFLVGSICFAAGYLIGRDQPTPIIIETAGSNPLTSE
ncbi:MAG: hypothetical protein AAB759_00570 [Patescibacteria group bacterium]